MGLSFAKQAAVGVAGTMMLLGFSGLSTSEERPYVPEKVVENGTSVKVSCGRPGLYAVRWMMRVQRKPDSSEALDYTSECGPVRAWVDEVDGIVERECPFYGYATDWTEGRYYLAVTTPGEYTVSVRRQNVPELGKVLLADIRTGPAGPEDFDRPNLLSDGGFENGCADFAVPYALWMQLRRGDVSAEFALDRDEFMEGTQSFRMVCRKGADVVTPPLPVVRGCRYRCSLWIKGDVEKPKLVLVDIRMHGGNPTVRRTTGGVAGSGTLLAGRQWKKLEFSFATPRPELGEMEESTATLRIRCETPGAYWVDDMEIQRIPAD